MSAKWTATLLPKKRDHPDAPLLGLSAESMIDALRVNNVDQGWCAESILHCRVVRNGAQQTRPPSYRRPDQKKAIQCHVHNTPLEKQGDIEQAKQIQMKNER
jgi:hypothetical protein